MASYLAGKRFAHLLVFPLLFVLLAFPIPGKIYMDVVFPLKLFVTDTSAALLKAIGYPARVYGNIIEIPPIVLGVVDACSGLNSLMAILTLSVFYSYLVIRTRAFRVLIVLAMLPLIVAANIVRVMATAMVAVQWGTEVAEGTLHSFWGLGVIRRGRFWAYGRNKTLCAAGEPVVSCITVKDIS